MANKNKAEEVKRNILKLLEGDAYVFGITDIVTELNMYSHLTSRKYVKMLESEGKIIKNEKGKYSVKS